MCTHFLKIRQQASNHICLCTPRTVILVFSNPTWTESIWLFKFGQNVASVTNTQTLLSSAKWKVCTPSLVLLSLLRVEAVNPDSRDEPSDWRRAPESTSWIQMTDDWNRYQKKKSFETFLIFWQETASVWVETIWVFLHSAWLWSAGANDKKNLVE